MFGRKKKSKKQKPLLRKSGRASPGKAGGVIPRFHAEGPTGDVWAALTGRDPRQIMGMVVGTVLHDGGTRPAWQWKRGGTEYELMAWPAESPIGLPSSWPALKAANSSRLRPCPTSKACRLILRLRKFIRGPRGLGADVAVSMIEGQKPMWFFDPLYSPGQG